MYTYLFNEGRDGLSDTYAALVDEVAINAIGLARALDVVFERTVEDVVLPDDDDRVQWGMIVIERGDVGAARLMQPPKWYSADRRMTWRRKQG